MKITCIPDAGDSCSVGDATFMTMRLLEVMREVQDQLPDPSLEFHLSPYRVGFVGGTVCEAELVVALVRQLTTAELEETGLDPVIPQRITVAHTRHLLGDNITRSEIESLARDIVSWRKKNGELLLALEPVAV